MKDSRELTTGDIKNICKTIEKSTTKKIIITHGTYTMPDTAKYLKANLKRKDQTIISAGSMIPLTGFAPSDAGFNLGYAIARVQTLKPGIYVCMNGRVFSSNEVVKQLNLVASAPSSERSKTIVDGLTTTKPTIRRINITPFPPV